VGAWLVTGVCALASPGARAVEAPKKPAIDPSAIVALQKMGTFLRSLSSMEVQAEASTDDVLPSGQKVEYSGTVTMKVQRPNRLRAEITSDRKNERLFYDGATFTVFQPSLGYYASFPAPPTLRELVDVLEKRYGVDLPLADLFRLGADEAQMAAIRGATTIGWSTIKGAVCTHYAFHQADIDWELWIQEGAQPLPRKIVITTTSEKSQPQHVSVLTWNLAPALDEQAFVFTPPPNAQRINFDVAGPPAPATGAKSPVQQGGRP
jgi:hypothetical protein